MAQDLLLARLRTGKLGDHPAVEQHEYPVAEADELSQLRADHHDAEAGDGELGDDLAHVDLGADIDAPGWLVEEQHLRRTEQPAGEHDLLLVATRHLVGQTVGIVGFGVQRLEIAAGLPALGGEIDERAAGEAGEVGDRHVAGQAPPSPQRL